MQGNKPYFDLVKFSLHTLGGGGAGLQHIPEYSYHKSLPEVVEIYIFFNLIEGTLKIHYLLFITFLFIQFTSTAQKGWFEQASGVTIDLRSVCFVDYNVGLAVGDSGTVLKTTDGGGNWNSNMIPTTGGLIKVQFSNDSTAWAINGTFSPGDV